MGPIKGRRLEIKERAKERIKEMRKGY